VARKFCIEILIHNCINSLFSGQEERPCSVLGFAFYGLSWGFPLAHSKQTCVLKDFDSLVIRVSKLFIEREGEEISSPILSQIAYFPACPSSSTLPAFNRCA
jgi:hypothetical protein